MQCLFFKKYYSWLYLLILLKKECISFHFISHWYPAQPLKELWNCIYFMHYLVTISFNMGLYKPSFSTDSFGNLVFVFLCFFTSCQIGFNIILINFITFALHNNQCLQKEVSGTLYFCSHLFLKRDTHHKHLSIAFNKRKTCL